MKVSYNKALLKYFINLFPFLIPLYDINKLIRYNGMISYRQLSNSNILRTVSTAFCLYK